MHFPLSDWIDAHADCRHNLGKSGMVGVVPMPEPDRALVAKRSPDEWTEELHRALSEYLRVEPARVFLTHGATEANSWVLFYLGRRSRGPRPRCRVHLPEYPPLVDLAERAGYRTVPDAEPVDVALLSLPRNPEGIGWSTADLDQWVGGARAVLLDETFREFSGRPSRSEAGTPALWTTGTFTKFFGADSVRVGYAIAPPEESADFARFHAIVADDLPAYSSAMALDLLARHEAISRKVRQLFSRNRAALRQALPSVPSVDGPVYFDRAADGDGDALTERCLRASVLVCPGSLFGAPEGVRICLTRPTFPRDLAAYVAVRGTARRGRRRTSAGGATAAARRRRADTGPATAGRS
jgi:histidinol-phosphate/aromatic aminotransferase/cobyric acid decarboxylase-like protein